MDQSLQWTGEINVSDNSMIWDIQWVKTFIGLGHSMDQAKKSISAYSGSDHSIDQAIQAII